jgi:hypothetical protein
MLTDYLSPGAFRVWNLVSGEYMTQPFWLNQAGKLCCLDEQGSLIEASEDFQIERFSGRYDQIMEPIFEGDVLTGDKGHLNIVRYDEQSAALALWWESESRFWRLPLASVLTVIGTIHDTPERLVERAAELI